MYERSFIYNNIWTADKDMKVWLIIAVIHMIFHTFTCILCHLQVCYKLTMWLVPNWLDSPVGRVLHRYHRDNGFESCSGLDFSGFKLHLQVVCITVMISHIFTNYFILCLAIFSSLNHGGAEPHTNFRLEELQPFLSPCPAIHVRLPRPTSWEYEFLIWKDPPGSGKFGNS